VQYIDGSGSKPYEIPYGAIVDVIIDGQCCGSHPFHPHGHHFFLIDSSQYYTSTESNDDYYATDTSTAIQGFQREVNKPIRDVVIIPFGGWIRIRFIADNPGIWMMHCHLQWHMDLGLSTLFIEGADELRTRYASGDHTVPSNHLAACQAPTAIKIDKNTDNVVESDNMVVPSYSPTLTPTEMPSLKPTLNPSKKPSLRPTLLPSSQSPSSISNTAPTILIDVNTPSPSRGITVSSTAPTVTVTRAPSRSPSRAPSRAPTSTRPPTRAPTSPTVEPTLSPTLPSDPSFVTMEFLVYGLRVNDFDQQEGVRVAFLWTMLETLPLLRVKITQTSVPSVNYPNADQFAGKSFLRVLLEAMFNVNKFVTTNTGNMMNGERAIISTLPAIGDLDVVFDDLQKHESKGLQDRVLSSIETESTVQTKANTPYKTVVTIEAEPFPEYRQAHNGGQNARQNQTNALQELINTAIISNEMTETFHFYLHEQYYDTSTIIQKLDSIFIQQGFMIQDDASNSNKPSLAPTRMPTTVTSAIQSQSLSQSIDQQEQDTNALNRISSLFYDDMTISLIVVIIIGITVFCGMCCISHYAYQSYQDYQKSKIPVIEGPFIATEGQQQQHAHPTAPLPEARPTMNHHRKATASFPMASVFISDSNDSVGDESAYYEDDRDRTVNTTELLMRNGIPYYDDMMVGQSQSNSTIPSTSSMGLDPRLSQQQRGTNHVMPVITLNSLDLADESTIVGAHAMRFPSPASSFSNPRHLN
jgi:hypothetical protein